MNAILRCLKFVLLRKGLGAKIEQCSDLMSPNAGFMISVAEPLFQVNDFHRIETHRFFSIC